jgi:hypothetical protein
MHTLMPPKWVAAGATSRSHCKEEGHLSICFVDYLVVQCDERDWLALNETSDWLCVLNEDWAVKLTWRVSKDSPAFRMEEKNAVLRLVSAVNIDSKDVLSDWESDALQSWNDRGEVHEETTRTAVKEI